MMNFVVAKLFVLHKMQVLNNSETLMPAPRLPSFSNTALVLKEKRTYFLSHITVYTFTKHSGKLNIILITLWKLWWWTYSL